MDKSIRYVREHCIAILLNDMVTHLVLNKPTDPLKCLVDYLQNEKSASSSSSSKLCGTKSKTDKLPVTEIETLDEILANEIALFERLSAADVSKLDKDVLAQLDRARLQSASSLKLLLGVATEQSVKDTIGALLHHE